MLALSQLPERRSNLRLNPLVREPELFRWLALCLSLQTLHLFYEFRS
jgi:hypothetical protein